MSHFTTKSCYHVGSWSRIEIQAYFCSTLGTDKTMGGTRIKKYNHGLMVYRESTRHYWRTLREFGESCEIHPLLADLYHLLLAVALVVQVGCLSLERSSRLEAILNEMGRAAAVEITIVVVSLIGWRKARPWALLLLLLGLWCRWSIESGLLGWPGYPSAWYIVSRRCWGSGVLDQPIPWRFRS
jgi:hypothetical protein